LKLGRAPTTERIGIAETRFVRSCCEGCFDRPFGGAWTSKHSAQIDHVEHIESRLRRLS